MRLTLEQLKKLSWKDADNAMHDGLSFMVGEGVLSIKAGEVQLDRNNIEFDIPPNLSITPQNIDRFKFCLFRLKDDKLALVIVGKFGTIFLYELPKATPAAVNPAATSPDSVQKNLKLMNVFGGDDTTFNPVSALTILSNNHLALGYESGKVEIWDIDKQDKQEPLKTCTPNLTYPSAVRDIDMTKDGKEIDVSYADGKCRGWLLEDSSSPTQTSDDNITHLAVSADERLVASIHQDGKLRLLCSGDTDDQGKPKRERLLFAIDIKDQNKRQKVVALFVDKAGYVAIRYKDDVSDKDTLKIYDKYGNLIATDDAKDKGTVCGISVNKVGELQVTYNSTVQTSQDTSQFQEKIIKFLQQERKKEREARCVERSVSKNPTVNPGVTPAVANSPTPSDSSFSPAPSRLSSASPTGPSTANCPTPTVGTPSPSLLTSSIDSSSPSSPELSNSPSLQQEGTPNRTTATQTPATHNSFIVLIAVLINAIRYGFLNAFANAVSRLIHSSQQPASQTNQPKDGETGKGGSVDERKEPLMTSARLGWGSFFPNDSVQSRNSELITGHQTRPPQNS